MHPLRSVHDAEPTEDTEPGDPHRNGLVGTGEGEGSVRRYDRHSGDQGLPDPVDAGEVKGNAMGMYEQRAREALETVADAPTTAYGVASATIDLANLVLELAREVDKLRG